MKAFSLIELLVVIAIVAIIAALAAPAYKQYSARAKVTNTLPLLESIVNDLKKTYARTGSFPASVAFSNVSFVDGVWTPAPLLGSGGFGYYTHTSNSAAIFFAIPNLPTGYGANIGIGLRENSGILTVKCGGLGPAGNDVIPEAMPSGCTCNVYNYVGGLGC